MIEYSPPVSFIFPGAARQLIGEKPLTVIVSPGYTPFEQLETKGRIGPWSDIHGLAATMHKAVTFQSPPKAADRLRDDPVANLVDQYVSSENYSKDFLDAILWGMQFDAGDRQTNSDWLTAFQAVKRVEPPSKKTCPGLVDSIGPGSGRR